MLSKIIKFLIITSYLFSNSYNMQLLSHLPYEQECSDITGFYQDGREFAVIGLQNAASFVDVTDPYNPFEVGRIEGGTSIWRDLKYWDRHVYIGTEAEDGVKVVSVDNLDEPELVYTILDVDNSHNIHVDDQGFLYIIGADDHDIWIYSLSAPSTPELVGTWDLQNGEGSTQGYCHDIEVYNNKLYCAAIYVGYFYIIDVSDKSNPTTLATHFTGYDGISTHDVAVTEDENFLFTGDENLGGHIKSWDISDYNNINLVDEYVSPDWEEHSVHNLYVKPGTDFLIMSYYADGTRVVDISDPTNLQEVAYYDMSDIDGLYVGNWGTYIDLPSGVIVSSDIEQGLFVLELGGVSILHQEIQDIEDLSIPYVNFLATVESFDGDVEDVTLHYSLDNINWDQANMTSNGFDDDYNVVMTFDQSGVIIYYYITASNSIGQTSRYPQTNDYVMFNYGDLVDILVQDFENNHNWYVESDATAGFWELGIPNGTFEQGYIVQTDDDHTPEGEKCFITGNAISDSPGQDDVDGGYTFLYSDIYDLSEYNDVLLTYWRWYTNNLGNNAGNDFWNVQATSDGFSWIDLEYTNNSSNQWEQMSFVLSNYIDLSSNVQFRYIASDIFNDGDNGSGGSLVEAALDDFKLEIIGYVSLVGDLNYDSQLNILDVVLLVNYILGNPEPSLDQFSLADLNEDDALDVLDIVLLVNMVLGS